MGFPSAFLCLQVYLSEGDLDRPHGAVKTAPTHVNLMSTHVGAIRSASFAFANYAQDDNPLAKPSALLLWS